MRVPFASRPAVLPRASSLLASLALALAAASGHAGVVPPGPADVQQKGFFGPVFSWPLMPIHMVLLQDGRVLTYGTNLNGAQGGAMWYSIWDPSVGTGPDAMLTLDNVWRTDTFCAAQTIIPATGEVLVAGGDRVVDGVRNYANNDVNLFNPVNNMLVKQSQAMAYQRWYATAVTNQFGEQVVMGGRMDRTWPSVDPESPALLPAFKGGLPVLPSATTVATYASTPEVYTAGVGWRTLTGAKNEYAYGSIVPSWNYPRAWLGPKGSVLIFTPGGKIFSLNSKGKGSIQQLTGVLGWGTETLPGAMYLPGRILTVRGSGIAKVVDVRGDQPVITPTANLSVDRRYGNATILADGKVWVNGGSSTGNDLVGAAYHSETWNPDTGTWTTSATASQARLYHSASLLMPDGSVLTGGGGAPGPLTLLNAEIYYPPYLYRTDGSGQPADRPVVTAAPTVLAWGQQFNVTLAAGVKASRVTWMRTGTVTHAFNNDQRYTSLGFKQSKTKLTMTLPTSRAQLPPGYYMLFVFDDKGVPSVARTIRLTD
ncbi:MAG TPA: galactose oxidase-like domain-containing protein [Ideonella sp.]|nr:galactose oxidase-like domain-containing protein [Ideonella sp.]